MRNVLWIVGLLGVAACGDDGGDGGRRRKGPTDEEPTVDGLDQGYTACGDVTCGPGQYCAFEGICENGCTSDQNCLEGESCVIEDELFKDGLCVEDEDPPTGGGGGGGGGGSDLEAECVAACSAFEACGMAPNDATLCRVACPDLPEIQQEYFVECGAYEACDDLRECLNVECFTDDECDDGQRCNDNFLCR